MEIFRGDVLAVGGWPNSFYRTAADM